MNLFDDGYSPNISVSQHSFSKRVRAHVESLPAATTREDRDYIVQSLQALGANAGPELILILGESDELSRFCAAQALSLLKIQDAIPVLIGYLNHPEEYIRRRR